MCILFVEDEFVISMMAEDALHDAGHQVMTASDALAAVTLITDHPDLFTCVVTDIHMPGGMTGLDLVMHVRQRYPAMPIVVATGRPDITLSEMRRWHQVELLAKPYGPARLLQSVEKLLDEKAGITRPEFWNARLIRLEGEVARETGVPKWQNPYAFGSKQHEAWAQGWDVSDDGAS